MSAVDEERNSLDGERGSEREDFLKRMAAKKQALYGGLDNLSDVSRLMENAEKVAGRLKFPTKVLNHLYANRQEANATRAEWELELRRSTALHALTTDYFAGAPAAELSQWIDRAGTAEALDRLPGSRGLMLLAFHGGYVILLRKLFHEYFPDGFVVLDRGRDKRRDMLFGALRALMDDRTLFVAPDSGLADQTGRITVLDAECPVALGAAFLAFETRCDTAFVFLRRTSAGVSLAIELGPRRGEEEAYAAFEERLHAFYAQQIQNVFAGDPRNIVLGGRWSRHFREMIADLERRHWAVYDRPFVEPAAERGKENGE